MMFFRDSVEKEFFDDLSNKFLVIAFALMRNEKAYLVDIKKEMGINHKYLAKVIEVLKCYGDITLNAESRDFSESDLWIELTDKGMEKSSKIILMMAKK